MKRNARQFYYSNFIDREEIKDSEGMFTGEYKISYTYPVIFNANIQEPAVNQGNLNHIEEFGQRVNYSRMMATHDMNCPIQNTSILWIETDAFKDDEIQPYDFIVQLIIKSLNVIRYSIRKVTISKQEINTRVLFKI